MDTMTPTSVQIPVRNPRTGEMDYAITPPSEEALDTICHDLRAAQPGWEALGVAGRIAVMEKFKAALEERKDEIVAALVTDTGRLHESVGEWSGTMGILDRWFRQAAPMLEGYENKQTSIPFLTLDGDLKPYGLLGVISPWNFPLLLSLIDAIPALIAGCAAIIKPSEVTPRFIKPVSEAIRAVPELARVLRYVEGAGETGAAVIDRVDMVCFTGSVPTGRKVGAQAAANFIPSFLELGGKDPSIILEGADYKRAARGLVWGSCANAGAACQSIERIYVHESLHDAFVDALVEEVNKVKLAYPNPEDGHISPIIFARQAETIQRHIDDALDKGAVMRSGEGIKEMGGGLYCFPVVLTGVDHSMAVMQDETFGPVLPVMPFKTESEAVTFANNTSFGLSGSVWGPDLESAKRVGRQLLAGGVSINDTTLTGIMQEGEKQSFKFSGLGGSRMGPGAIRRFVRQKLYIVNQQGYGHDAMPEGNPWWYKTE